MGLREPLERLRTELLRRGLPRDYVSRAVEELADHHTDLMADGSSSAPKDEGDAWRQLGDLDGLSRELVHKFQARTFAGRHPLVTFVLAPIPALLFFWTAVWLAGFMTLFGAVLPRFGWRLGQTVAEMSPFMLWMMLSWHYAILFAPPALAALWFQHLAWKSGRGLAWAAPACLLVALFALAFVSDFRLPYESFRGRLGLGLGLPLPATWQRIQFLGMWRLFHPERQALQALCPLAILAYAYWRASGGLKAPYRIGLDRRALA